MKTPTKTFIFFISICILLAFTSGCTNTLHGDVVSIDNGKIKLGFERSTGKLISFSDIATSYEYIDSAAVEGLPWLLDVAAGTPAPEKLPTKVSFQKPDPLTLNIEWQQADGTNGLKVIASVSLDKEKALSYWNIKVEGMGEQNIQNVKFPVIAGIKDLGNEELAAATWLGSLIKNPRAEVVKQKTPATYTWNHPGHLSMQLMALYNKESSGIYFSCNDTLAYTKNFSLTFDTNNKLEYSITNIPPFDNRIDSYQPAYQAILGSFRGDWITAAKMYREWGIQQKWCRESRFKNNLTAEWLPQTGIWVWNRGKSPNVLPEAIDLQERAGVPVNVFWHWWHNCSYDDYFPEYLPPREGGKSFIEAVTAARQKGVRSIVYMNSFQWGTSTDSWKSENAEPYCAKTIDGKTYEHAYNIFTNKSITPMCMATEFWQNKYASLCDSVINFYQASGVYMDQACMNFQCYDKSHGHDLGGGNYWINGFQKLTSLIRSKITDKKQSILAGEGSGEDWISNLDLFLTLETSRERYAGISNVESIPLYQAVYHDYAITYGSYSSLVYPPYDELWPAQYSPANKEKALPEDFNSQFLMEQSRAFVWGMQPTIANYHAFLAKDRKEEIDFLIKLAKTRYKALGYLLYGEYCRTPEINIPNQEIDISKLSIYVGRTGNNVSKFKKTVPSLYTGTWKSPGGAIGIALASISDKQLSVDFTINLSDYDLPSEGEVYVTTDSTRLLLQTYAHSKADIHFDMPARGVCVLEFVPKQ
ncbi:DUF6259 domain-containing protein [Parabacteroides provencensis]|uniref:DUF6259 domain-containing protein n=1 Tax=Parabacteroides provencensis TaxID=1944636 RepID=UPI000C14BF1C|nr:DUF6259 domain-containing protein [Parabacteroides provencensis]